VKKLRGPDYARYIYAFRDENDLQGALRERGEGGKE
jgi:hypothetical protein